MKAHQWEKIIHFKKSEFNNPDKMEFSIINKLDKFRDCIGSTVIVTSDYRDSSTSMHGKGVAVDVMFPELELKDMLDIYLEAERFNFNGIGFYVSWKLGKKVLGGLHLDTRNLQSSKRGARWLCYKDENGKQQYVSLNRENIELYLQTS